MLVQSLFALAVPAAPQPGDASAAPADGEFGRLVDVAPAAEPETVGPARPPAHKALPDHTGPQILPGEDALSLAPKTGKEVRPEVLPAETGLVAPDDLADPVAEVLPAEPDTAMGEPRVGAKALKDAGPRPEILPAEVGPVETARPEILPAEVGPAPQPAPQSTPAKSVPALAPVAPGVPSVRSEDVRAALPQDDEPAPESGPTSTVATAPDGDAAPQASPAAPASGAPRPANPAAPETPRIEPSVAGVGADPAVSSAPEAAPSPATEAPLFSLSRVAHETLADLTAQIVKRLEGKFTRFEMALTPEDLGRVDVSLEMGEDGSLTARLAFDTPAAAAEMRAQVDQLRRQLEQAGFQLARDALEFSHREGASGQRQDGFERRPGRAFAAARDLADRAEAAPLINVSLSLGSARDRVDVKV
ncbi:MAG TPA: flagellar hook-length control protein FliK [Brevundimonas sp.]|jgi:hypothetical protein|uniref:flagellar hook-length control protein FliK n=1 Tax=Brevundimonas sp. TaxID=1871086 RepID=UPI002DF5487E|nr:flagellar hook-length control protein FliK [Brevundimonas sp.]